MALSPHCDDAVFGAGDFIATNPRALIVTIFAGAPDDDRLRPWDAECGFRAGDDVMRHRRAEDASAVAHLGARPAWLPFRDDQYGRDADAPAIAEALDAIVRAHAAAMVAMPLGLYHRDHLLTSDAALIVVARRPRITWVAYEDAIYRALPGDPVRARLAALGARGFAVTRVGGCGRPASALKRRAVACYGSQRRGLSTGGRGYHDVLAPERLWTVRTA